ncbi:MAG TPA: YCF48-related protein [Streptosporangiaceae bacterium]|nr:YCF48-related protein [Streptosporangiaceae bacterium]
MPRFPAGFLTGVQFVSAADGWVVGQDKILATTDGGRQWTVQDSGQLDLTSVDFVSSEAGWAVGTHSVLATLDGGAHWAALPESCPLIRSVHFVSPDVGFAVADGCNVTDFGPEAPEVAGVVMVTSDGGRSWSCRPPPAPRRSISATRAMAGWAPAGGCTAPLTGATVGRRPPRGSRLPRRALRTR